MKKIQTIDDMINAGASGPEAARADNLFQLLRPGLKIRANGRVDTSGGEKTPLGLYRTITDHIADDIAPHSASNIPFMQTALYVMVGGGLLGRSAAEQPLKFYIDPRVSKRPYGKNDIMKAVKHLITEAKRHGMDPNNLPAIPNFHNMEVF
jgi:hypothetical protein